MMVTKSFVVLTPVKQSQQHNVVRIHRESDIDGESLIHAAGGNYTGIIVNKLGKDTGDQSISDVAVSFSVWITDGTERRQEKRSLFFWHKKDVDSTQGKAVVHSFFKQLMINMPKNYVTFMKRILTQMQSSFPEIQEVKLDYKILTEEEEVAIPDAAQYDSSSEVEEVTVGHVQEILEHAFPNGLSMEIITEALRCSEEMALQFLRELESKGIARRVGDEWLRIDNKNVDAVVREQHAKGTSDQPTVAIISCLFVEKQAVDALIEDRSVIHKYKSGGDSNVYTTGRIGQHCVVATKLALIGDSREAITSAGSITTRLLGNFQKIEHVFVVGVGGAVPHYTDAALHARLGDVIVSASRPDAYVYAHDIIVDRNTQALTGFAVRKWNPVDHVVEKIIREGADTLRANWETMTSQVVDRLNQEGNETDFSAPSSSTDVLAIPVAGGNVVVLPHPNAERKGPEVHIGSVGAVASLKQHNENDVETEEETVSQVRERFAAQFGLRAVDCGFDSVVAAIVGSRIDSWALVRGVADYQHGQSRASRKWQAHASARAAAMMRCIVEKLPTA